MLGNVLEKVFSKNEKGIDPGNVFYTMGIVFGDDASIIQIVPQYRRSRN